MTAIPTAWQSKTNWMKPHLKHCSRLNNKSFGTILIGDSLIAGLTLYSKVWNEFFKPLNAFTCRIGGDGVQHVLWRAHDLHCFSSLRNVIILCGTNNLCQGSPEDIANGRIIYSELFQTRKQCYQRFCLWHSSSWLYIFYKSPAHKRNKISKSSCSINHINFINQGANWIQISGSLKPDLSVRISCTWWKREILF